MKKYKDTHTKVTVKHLTGRWNDSMTDECRAKNTHEKIKSETKIHLSQLKVNEGLTPNDKHETTQAKVGSSG